MAVVVKGKNLCALRASSAVGGEILSSIAVPGDRQISSATLNQIQEGFGSQGGKKTDLRSL
jgi:hypothetical protein